MTTTDTTKHAAPAKAKDDQPALVTLDELARDMKMSPRDGSHADGREGFYDAIDRLMEFQEGQIRIEAPALRMTTAELVRESGVPQSLLAWAHSCHIGPLACGGCRGCVKHYEVTAELYGIPY